MATTENIMASYAGESQANKKYLAFAKKADTDGFPQTAKLFRAASEAENVHAQSFLRLSVNTCDTDGCPVAVHSKAHSEMAIRVKTTKENLQEAAAGENYEYVKMYPEFIKAAQKEGNKKAEYSFKFAMAVEKIHYDLFSQALKSIEGLKDAPEADVFVCSVCGNTVAGSAPAKCPICGAAKNKFNAVK